MESVIFATPISNIDSAAQATISQTVSSAFIKDLCRHAPSCRSASHADTNSSTSFRKQQHCVNQSASRLSNGQQPATYLFASATPRNNRIQKKQQQVQQQIDYQTKLEKLRILRERVNRLTTKEQTLQGHITDLKALLNKVNTNGEETINRLRLQNSLLEEQLSSKLQTLEHAKEHSHHHEQISAFWQACVNTKEYEKINSDEYQEEESEGAYCDESDDDFEMDEELMKHIGCNMKPATINKELSSITSTTASTTQTLSTTPTKDLSFNGRRFSDCGADFDKLPELSTQPSVSSSSQDSSSQQFLKSVVAAVVSSVAAEAVGGAENRRGGSLDCCNMQGKRGVFEEREERRREEEQEREESERLLRLQLQQQLQGGKGPSVVGSGCSWNIIAIKPENIIQPQPKSMKRVYCLQVEEDQLVDLCDCGVASVAALAALAEAAPAFQ